MDLEGGINLNPADFFHEGVAFYPSNEEGIGEMLRICKKDGETIFMKHSVQTYLRHLARHFGVDLTSLRQQIGQVLSKKQWLPLTFALHWTLMPVRVRIPIGQQPSYGWVVARAIEEVKEVEGKLLLFLKGGHKLTILTSEGEFRRMLRNVQLAELHYEITHRPPEWLKEGRDSYFHLL